MKKVQANAFATLTCRAVGLFTIGLLLTAGTVRANTLYWDPDATKTNNSSLNGLGLGGNGTWSTSTANWWSGSGSDAVWNNANNNTAVFWGTNAAPTVTLGSGITAGGLAFDTTGYLIDAGANTLTFGAATNAITLNNVAAATISNAVSGAGNVTLTGGKYVGVTAGTLNLNGTSAGGWSGTTTIGNGMTLALSGLNQALLNTTGITINGGGFTLISTTNAAEVALDRVNNSAPITANGGAITYTTTIAASALAFAETLGPVNLISGQLAITESLSKNAIGQTLTLGGLTQSGSAVVMFSSGINRSTVPRNVIIVSGASATAANKIIGPWATFGTSAIAQSDYAIYLGGGTGEFRNATATTGDSTWSTTWADTENYNFANSSNGTVLAATRNFNTLRHSSASAEMLDLGGFNLGTYGLLNGAAGALTITNSTGSGVVTLPAITAGNLYVTTGLGSLTIAAPITDNTGSLTLVKSGTGGPLTLSGSNTFSGGLVINAGLVQVYNGANLGPGGIAVNGSAQLGSAVATGSSDSSDLTYDDPVAINNGAILSLSVVTGKKAGNYTFNGPVTGTGGLQFNFGGTSKTFIFASLGNIFEGPMILGGSASYAVAEVNSLADSVTANGVIRFPSYNVNQPEGFRWGAGATNALVLNNRQFDIAANQAGSANTPIFIENANTNAVNTITINTDLLVTSTNAVTQWLGLRGTNTGNNVFAGRIGDGALVTNNIISLVKLDSGTWSLAGSNTYSGATLVNAGTLKMAASGSVASTNVTVAAGATLELAGSTSLPNQGTLTLASTGAKGKVILGAGVAEYIGALVLGTTNQPSGTYGSSSSVATNQLDAYFSGSGVLYVGMEAPPPPPEAPKGTLLMVW